MSRSAGNKPRPYSTLRGGRIVWVYPGEDAPPAKVRSRLETDDEVRKRVLDRIPAYDTWARQAARSATGQVLDRLLQSYDLPARHHVDEVQP